MRRVLRVSLWLAAGLAVLAAFAWLFLDDLLRVGQGLPRFTHGIGAELHERVAMRDGVRLATTVQLPAGEGPWPVVLIRNPYDAFDTVARIWCRTFAHYGYACVRQDVRGQIASEGEWLPLFHERDDGLDTLAWLAAQPWQNQRVALFGPSYLAAAQWAVAGGLPPQVKTFVPTSFTTDLHDVLYQDGMFRFETLTAWAALMPGRGMRMNAGPSYQQALHHRPHVDVDQRWFGARLDWYRDWIRSPAASAPLWQREDYRSFVSAPEHVAVPVLVISGWYDAFVGPQLRDFERLASRAQSKLVVGPWTHIAREAGDIPSPDARGGLAQWPLVLDWLGHYLKDEPLAQRPTGAETYVMHGERWEWHAAWPPPAHPLRLWLDRADAAQACEGGRLAAAPPVSATQGRYRYDPDHPVPTRGGAGMLAFALPGFEGAPPASVRQDGLCERDDVLSFASDPYPAGLEIAGRIAAQLRVASDAPDTAFTVKLCEVLPDGTAFNIADGITSLAYRNGAAEPQLYAPGSEVSLHLELWPIAWQLRPGSHLRLDVSSSNFPAYHAHPNRAGLWSEIPDAVVAEQQIGAGGADPAWVEVPVADAPSAARP